MSTTTTIIDNRDGNTLLTALQRMGAGGRDLAVASAFFSLDALLLLADSLQDYEHIRILFGDDASPKQRRLLLQKLRIDSDADLLRQREKQPLLTALKKVEALFAAGRIEARCYTADKFHAKAYLIMRPDVYPAQMAVIGSGNFTRPGLVQNIELNVELTPEQTNQLRDWYEERWAEAAEDIVTDDVLNEIRRQIDLYDPYFIYLKALHMWGQDRQGPALQGRSRLLDMLDRHQEDGYLQAVKIIEKQNGVMICDGVGLGKSFIALALIEHFCREGKNVLLLAPKNILENSWKGYLREYMSRYTRPFGNIHDMPMTALGFDPDDGDEDQDLLDLAEGDYALAKRLCERSDVIVIDESHNFRTRSANRYRNLYNIIHPISGKRKAVILLTATPINTAYADMSSQLALVTHDEGKIDSYSIEQIRKAARELDKDRPQDFSGQLSLQLGQTPNDTLNRVLERIVIQRSRTTCKELSAAAGRVLRFPTRRDPECIEYTIGSGSQGYRGLIELADERFRPLARYLEEVRYELGKLKDKDTAALPARLRKGPGKGIKLAAFWTEQYRHQPVLGSKLYRDEVHLAGLVFANAMKQLESSPVAFQGIIQSIALGLIARLRHVFVEEAEAVIAPHVEWIRTPIFATLENGDGEDLGPDLIEDGDTLDQSGEEVDAWLQQAVRSRRLESKLRDFTSGGGYDVERWKNDIIGDLEFLREIHAAILEARRQPDPKLVEVSPVIERELSAGGRVLVFTQSQRTAEYLERELSGRFGGHNVARIDSRVEDTRAAIIHAFCPGYNKPPTDDKGKLKWPPSVPKRVDVLISTDVLSEGVNLQEASAILNYDIHWNPVRLIQRIGRVDRRLDPAVTPGEHEFSIYNVLPPEEIEKIINLVESVENRTLKISRALGIDSSFFRASDPSGTLKEFNKVYEGEMRASDVASTNYIRCFDSPDPAVIEILDQLPPGAFGAWGRAPQDGLFALFTMEPTEQATERDREHFAQVIGRPVLTLEQPGRSPLTDAGAILDILSNTTPGEHSDNPSSEEQLSKRLGGLKNAARGLFADVQLPRTIAPKLVCWLELRKGDR